MVTVQLGTLKVQFTVCEETKCSSSHSIVKKRFMTMTTNLALLHRSTIIILLQTWEILIKHYAKVVN